MKKKLLALAIFSNILFTVSAQNNRQWSTYFGGSDLDAGFNVATDAAGNVYMTGQTSSLTGIATPGSHQSVYGGGANDAYLAKFGPSGNLIWATYYGGTDSDYGYAIKVDASGNIYLVGYTSSTNAIVTPGTYQTIFNGTTEAFLVKFNSSGTRLWGTYYGGPLFELASGVATDAAGNVYMAGYTQSTSGIASAGGFQTTSGGLTDAFLAKFNANGNILWSTFYGGAGDDYANDVATDNLGNVVMCGSANSNSGIASAGGFQNTLNAGSQDAFVVKFDANGNRLWGTYYGGVQLEQGTGIAVSGSTIYLAGETASTTNIASGGFQNSFGGFRDAFLVKFDGAGNRIWATYYGGSNVEEGEDVGTDQYGNVFLAGDTYSPNNGDTIATPNGFQTSLTGSENHFLAAFTPNGIRVSATYFGIVHEEEGHMAIGPYAVYMSGWTYVPTGIATPGAFQTTNGGGLWDAFLVKYYTSVPDTGVIVPNDLTPPTATNIPPKIYLSVSIFDKGSISLTNAVLKNFSPNSPLPASGSAVINFTCDFSGSYSNSGPAVPVTCTANVSMKVTLASASGSTRVYDTEMLQLDLSGGTLPAGVTLRESPTLKSTGLTVVTDIGAGQFRYSSFFDVFTELSTDGGQTWQSSTSSPARLQLQNDIPSAPIPTLSQWGLILFSILMLGVVIFIRKTSIA
jgi:hypothetical protein